ncbi:MAG: helix-turn-helix domain-containing protein [Nitrococcus mobilis]|nr:helix-turn-helix domain-containing protein [Nitrococcus mobilis]
MPNGLSIGALSRRTGCSIQTIRHYERIGVMPQPRRTCGNQRRYTVQHLDRLNFIRHARELGFSLEQIRELLMLADYPDQSCAEIDRIARTNLAAIESRLKRLELLRHELQRMASACRGGRVADCRVIRVLSGHDQCHTEHMGSPEAFED